MKRFAPAIIMLSLFIGLSCCGDGPISNVDEIVFPKEDVSYSAHVEPFLTLACSYGGCHGSSGAGGVVLNDYLLMMNRLGLVVPGNAEGSALVQVLDQRLPHFTYFSRNGINNNHIEGIKAWINEGAKLN